MEGPKVVQRGVAERTPISPGGRTGGGGDLSAFLCTPGALMVHNAWERLLGIALGDGGSAGDGLFGCWSA